MALQFLPIIKAVTPYIAQVASAAIPAFTAKSEKVKSDEVLNKQIQELQEATIQNAQSIHLIAEKLQQGMQSIQQASQDAQKQIATYKLMIVCALAMSGLSLVAWAYVLFR